LVQLTLGTKRTALTLYGVLLVLPTLVLGGLLWRQLVVDHQTMLNTVPGAAGNATQRLGKAIEGSLRAVIDREEQRAFFEYKLNYFPPGTLGTDLALVPSPLRTGPTRPEILGYFSYSHEDAGLGRPPVVLLGSRGDEPDAEYRKSQILSSTLELRHRERERQRNRLIRMNLLAFFDLRPRAANESNRGFLAASGGVTTVEYKLPLLAINLSEEENIDCMRDELPTLRGLEQENQTVSVSAFRVHFYRDALGSPRVVATRWVGIPKNDHLAKMSGCFEALGHLTNIEQGFFIDPDWLFRQLPASQAESILDRDSQLFIPMDAAKEPTDPTVDSFEILPVRQLELEVWDPSDRDYGAIKVQVNMRDLERRFRTQSVRFLGVAAMLVVSLGTGLLLLLRSVNRDLETARRTENFIAAVTHELRTPVAAIKLYGEMLQDGWVDDDPGKLKEYYRRIVRETGRLETLVENVLEKSQIARREAEPEPGDLNAVVETLEPSLQSLAPDGITDLAFEYGEDLPQVMLIPEGVRSIVTNLVENARKYAPVKRDVADPEPIVVRTQVLAGMAVLDVMDRGPGIPHAERTKIFQAFYRVGNETTRTARGTGLGLHLVMLQTTAMGARVGVLDRKGGGTVFRVTFQSAPAFE
jgi:signal transduction histidine kinase